MPATMILLLLAVLVGYAVGSCALLGWLTMQAKRTRAAANTLVPFSYMNVENQARLGTMPPSSRVVDPPIFG